MVMLFALAAEMLAWFVAKPPLTLPAIFTTPRLPAAHVRHSRTLLRSRLHQPSG